MSNAADLISEILQEIDVQIDGSRPWDMKIHDPRFFGRVIAEGALGLGESYMDEWWDCDRLDELMARVIRADLKRHVKVGWHGLAILLKERFFNPQAKGHRAEKVGREHYDTGNDLFRTMLDRRMTYSCAYWVDAENLDEAQEKKLDLVCRKLYLEPGMKVLDIGCGWGSFAKFAAERYGVEVVGINNSREQVELGNEMCRGLPVEIRFQDYREVEGSFDRVASIGMFEHVGPKNYETFMKVVAERMDDSGLFLLHTIGAPKPNKRPDAWTDKYIFPGGMLPTVAQIGKAVEGRMLVEDWQNIGVHYEQTLMAWYQNFENGWPELEAKYGRRFYRMWRFYLLAMAGAFRARSNQVWQVVMSTRGILGGYKAIR